MVGNPLKLLFLVGMASLHCNAQASEASLRRMEREVTARLTFEILWHDLPQGLVIPGSRPVKLGLYLTARSLFYCSHDLSACAQYRLEAGQIGQRVRSVACNPARPPCDQTRDDTVAVRSFSKQSEPAADLPIGPGPRSIGGLSPDSPGILWTMTATLGNRTEIIAKYKRMRPAALSSLTEWIQRTHGAAGYKSITISCFEPSDPVVHLFGDRPEKGPIVFSVFWDKEREEWVFAGMLYQTDDRGRIAQLKAVVEAVSCETVRFK